MWAGGARKDIIIEVKRATAFLGETQIGVPLAPAPWNLRYRKGPNESY